MEKKDFIKLFVMISLLRVQIPEDMEIAETFVKKTFLGGLYATYTVPLGFFDKVEKICSCSFCGLIVFGM